jgi:hypothetical protein
MGLEVLVDGNDATRGKPRWGVDFAVYELIPLFAGIAAGIGLSRIRSSQAIVGVTGVAVAGGALASAASGELEVSAAFLVWDVGQGIAAGIATLLVTRRLAATGVGRAAEPPGETAFVPRAGEAADRRR